MMKPRTLSSVIAGNANISGIKTKNLCFFHRGDCEGNNFFVTSSFLERKYTNSQAYYDEIRGTGLLYKYLLDPENFFTDPVTTNLTRLLYDASKADLAKRRFHNDISILNFFFDTPMTNELKREMRVTILDQISAIGGTLGNHCSVHQGSTLKF